MKTFDIFTTDALSALVPEFLLLCGILVLILIPNLGKGTFRIPLTQIRIPWLLGGQRFALTSHPRIPGILATLILGVAFVFSLLSQIWVLKVELFNSDVLVIGFLEIR